VRHLSLAHCTRRTRRRVPKFGGDRNRNGCRWRLRVIQSIGRVKWIEGSESTGKDNACWHLFDKPSRRVTKFYGRIEKEGT
jgi:hypothetical protein